MIKLNNLSLQRGAKVLLENAELTIYPGQCWGLIGPNGSGKSSLFKLLLGQLQADLGDCHIPVSWAVAHMAQEVNASTRSAVEYVLDGDHELREIEQAIEQNADCGDQLAKHYARLEAVDGYSARSRAQQLLHGLGFTNEEMDKSVSDFSGGWRIRLNLAQALMCRSDLLLLDEPTNHLDLDATLWLEQWLKRYEGTLVIISHDRDFIDNVVQHIANIEASKIVTYTGNYSSYEKQKAERLALQQAAYEKQQVRIAEIEGFVRRFKAKASKAKQAQSRIKELERMELISQAHVDSPFTFKFPEPERIPQVLISMDQASIGYDGKAIVSNLNLTILGDTRLGLLGHNGAGKSTLIKALANSVSLIDGEKTEGAHLKIGYFAQHQLEALDLEASSALHLQRISPKATEQEIRNFLGGFGFQGDRAFETITHFSGGEKARLALAIVAWQKPNLLLLDEPTNHLDLEVRHALTVALQEFPGAIITVSHDRHLLKNTVEEFLLVHDGRAETYNGDLYDYQRWLLDEGQDTKKSDAISELQSTSKVDKREARQIAALRREKLKPLSQAVKKLEKEMAGLHKKLESVEAQLADPSIYESDNEDLPRLIKEQGQLKQQLETVEEDWLEKSEALELATSSDD